MLYTSSLSQSFSISSFSPPIPLYANTRPTIQFESDSDDSTAVKRRGSLPAAPKIQGPSVKSARERRALSAQSQSSPEPQQLRRQFVSPELTESPEQRPPVASPGNTTPAEGQRSSATGASNFAHK